MEKAEAFELPAACNSIAQETILSSNAAVEY